jgi:hypothetical protein
MSRDGVCVTEPIKVLFERITLQVGALNSDGKWIQITAEELDSGLLDQHPHFKQKGV